MKTIIKRVFERGSGSRAAAPNSVSSELTHSDIESYYRKIIAECLRRLLVAEESIEIAVRRSGSSGGMTGFAGYVRILRWDPVMTPVLLQNAPVIDARIRKVVRASVLLEHTHFAGLWFQATASTEGAPTTLMGMPAELIHQPGGPPSI